MVGCLKPAIQKQRPRKVHVHLFSKADWVKLKSHMKDFQSKFLSSHIGNSVEELWMSFTNTLDACVDECIPLKVISGKSSLPWIIQEIKCLIRKRDRLYSSYKVSGDNRKREDFQALRQQIKKKIKRSYQTYLEGLIGLSDNDQTCDRKKLFSFLKRSRQDQQGPSPLLDNGKLTENTTEQCNIHNKQFQSVFTSKSPLSLALLSQMKLQDLVDKGQVNPESVPPKHP